MSEIIERQELIMENLLSFRGKITQKQMQEEMNRIGETLQSHGLKKNGAIVTATYAVEQSSEGPLMDIEILVPIDRKMDLPNRYTFKPLLKLVNALNIRHIGHPRTLANTINRLNEYIIRKNIHVITATYNVTVKEARSEDEINDMVIDVYVGCSQCIV